MIYALNASTGAQLWEVAARVKGAVTTQDEAAQRALGARDLLVERGQSYGSESAAARQSKRSRSTCSWP